MAEKYELAALDYVGGMKYKDIAEKYDVSIDTVKSWKKRHWQDLKKGAHIPKKGVHTKNSSASKLDDVPPEVEKVAEAFVEETEENATLSDVQRFFCLYFVKYLNATKAYQKAYDSTYEVANKNAYTLMVKHGIREEITRLKKARAAGIMLDKNDVLQKYIDIAFADLGDYVEYGTEEVEVLGEDGYPVIDVNGDPQTYQRSYVRFKNSAALDNTIISEVKQGKDGVSVKLHDKMKALEVLAKYTDLLDDKTKSQIQIEKARVDLLRAQMDKDNVDSDRKLKVEKLQLDIEKAKLDIAAAKEDDKDKGPIQIQIIGAKKKE